MQAQGLIAGGGGGSSGKKVCDNHLPIYVMLGNGGCGGGGQGYSLSASGSRGFATVEPSSTDYGVDGVSGNNRFQQDHGRCRRAVW